MTEAQPGCDRRLSKPQRRFPRSRAGCLTCRRRKKKCDESRPRCAGCTRNELGCVWFGQENRSTVPSGESNDGSSSVRHCSEQPSHKSGDDTAPVASPSSPLDRVPWSGPFGSFTTSLRATMLTSCSGLFLQHYLVETATFLATSPFNRNPFIAFVMPLAYTDDLLMHSVMAIGGAHLSLTSGSSYPEVSKSTWAHYSCVLRSLRVACSDLPGGGTPKLLRMLLILLMTAQFESIAGTCLTGGAFPHLSASQQLITWLQTDYPPSNPDDERLLGFLLETYTYMVLVNHLGPHGGLKGRNIPTIPYVDSLAALSKYQTFGMLFSGCHGLFELIPRISELFQKRVLEDASEEVSFETKSMYDELRAGIAGWKLPEDDQCRDKIALAQRLGIAETYRQSVEIYLETAISGPIVPELVRLEIQGRVAAMATIVAQTDLSNSLYGIILSWPAVIVGSCVVDPLQQQLIIALLQSTKYRTWNSVRCIELLQMLWEDADPRAFGPYGLTMVMEKKDINFCMT